MLPLSDYYKTLTIKTFFLVVSALFSNIQLTNAADTLHVVTHHRVSVVTDPSKGENLYKAWGVFPSIEIPVRSIKLRVTMGCPDNMRCADWDYKDHITIRRTGGVKGSSADYEIGRMLTPYGGAFGKDWQFTWEVDVTDFSILLRDSVEIEYNHNGYEPSNDRGWAVTVEFEIITGPPSWQPLAIQKIYDGAFPYGQPKDIESFLKPVDITAHQEADFGHLRVVQTGHGMDKPDNCAEFCNKYREIWWDGNLIDKRDIWKHCGDNPLYPQAGTWVYDRADWCPGNLMQADVHRLGLKKGQIHTVDINMEPYTATTAGAKEYITAYFIQYKNVAEENDVKIEDIIKPSLKDIHRRYNPASMHPEITVTNKGSAVVHTMNIHYGTAGQKPNNFNWEGNLKPGETISINLPGSIESTPGVHTFKVDVRRPNGRRDGFREDNVMVANYEGVPVHGPVTIVYLMTNNEPADNSYVIKNVRGNVIHERPGGSLLPNTIYRDTLNLPEGNYEFVLVDSAGNGLEFWANSSGGRGKARLLNTDGAILVDFNSDFGSLVKYSFRVGGPVPPVGEKFSYDVYPTRTDGKTTFDYYANFPHDVVVQIVADPGGQVVESHEYKALTEGIFTYDLSRFSRSRYYLKVLVDGVAKFKKRIRVKEHRR